MEAVDTKKNTSLPRNWQKYVSVWRGKADDLGK